MSGGPEDDNELPYFSDGPEDGAEIEITEDDLGGDSFADYVDTDEQQEEQLEEVADEPDAEEDDEEEEPEPEEKPKRKRSSENRIQELSRRAQEAERRYEEANARAAQEAALRAESDRAMMAHYEQRLTREATAVKAQLQEAISVGDTAQQVELQTQLFQLQSDISGVESWKQQQAAAQAEAAANPPVRDNVREAQQTPQLEATTARWIQSNSWFQPQSPDFDPEMHEEATGFAQTLERRLRRAGRADEIGGVEYFKKIDQHIREEFADAFEDDDEEPAPAPRKATPQMSRNTTVAPVSRAGQPSASGKQSRTVTLSADERRMAHTMADSGAYKHPNGKRMTHAEAEKYHAAFKLKQTRR